MNYIIYFFYPENWTNISGEFKCILDVSKNPNILSCIPRELKYISKLINTTLYCNNDSGYINDEITKKLKAESLKKGGESKYSLAYIAMINKNSLCEFLFKDKLNKIRRREIKKIITKEKLKKKRKNIFLWKIFYFLFSK